jgi:hypothetical protein
LLAESAEGAETALISINTNDASIGYPVVVPVLESLLEAADGNHRQDSQ